MLGQPECEIYSVRQESDQHALCILMKLTQLANQEDLRMFFSIFISISLPSFLIIFRMFFDSFRLYVFKLPGAFSVLHLNCYLEVAGSRDLESHYHPRENKFIFAFRLFIAYLLS